MSYLTSNLIVDLRFWDDTTVDFSQVPALVSDQTGSNDFFISGLTAYTSIGATRFNGNVKFNSDLTADHAYYIHRYL